MQYDLFISYASADLAHAQAVHEKLLAAGFKVWFDKARLNPGCKWHEEIEQGCEASRMILPILTPRWRLSQWTRYETYAHDEMIPLWFEGPFDEVFTPPLRRFQADAIDFTRVEQHNWQRLIDSIRLRLANPAPQRDRRLIRMRYGPPQYFVGREDTLNEIHEKLWLNPTAALTQGRVQTVTAMGGVGKTTLVREYVERFWRLYPQTFWVDCRLGLMDEFAAIFDLLFPTQKDSGLDKPIKARRTLDELAQTQDRPQRLLILDDTPDEHSLLPWIPRTGRCHTIVTSRFAAWSNPAETCLVWVLAPEASRELLLRRAGRKWEDLDADERTAVDELAQQLGYLPLALEQAAAYIGAPGTACHYRKYLELFKTAEKHFLDLDTSKGATEYPASVYATWRTTIDRLPPESRAILRLASFMAPTPIPHALWLSASPIVRLAAPSFATPDQPTSPPVEPILPPEVEVRQWIAPLAQYSMVQAQGGLEEGDFSVHGLVQTVERHAIAPNLRPGWVEMAADALLAYVPASGHIFQNWPIWRLCSPHGEAIAHHTAALNASANPDLLGGLAGYFQAQGNYNKAERFFREALSINQRLFTGDHRDVATSLNNLAGVLQSLGRSAEAEPIHRDALAMTQRLFKGDNPSVAGSLNNLASALQSFGRSAEAEPIYRDALAMTQRLFKGDHPDVAASLNNLAFVLNSLGRSAEAKPIYRDALSMRQRLFKGDHPDVAASLNNLGTVLNSLGRAADAEPMCRDALSMRQRLFKGDHPDVATSLNNLAGMLVSLGRAAEAEPIYRDALAMHQRLFKGDHPTVTLSLNNLASVLQSLGRAAEAEPIYRDALAMNQRNFKGDHPKVTLSLNNLASVVQSLGRAAEAEPIYRDALAMRQRLFKGDHPDVAGSLNNLALVLESLGRAAETEPIFRDALAMHQRLFKEDHPNVATSLNNLAGMLVSLGRAAEAEPIYRDALAMHHRLFKGDHPNMATSLNNLASVLQSLGRAAEAEPIYRDALAMRQRLFKGDHPDVAGSLHNLAFVLEPLGRAAEAEPIYRDALVMNKRLFKGDHPNVALSLNNLALVLQSLGRAAEAEPIYRDALAMNQRLFKGDHPNVALSLNNLAFVLESLGRAAQAEPVFREALAMYQRLFKGDHPNVAVSLNNLAAVLNSLGRAAEAEPLRRDALAINHRLLKRDHPT